MSSVSIGLEYSPPSPPFDMACGHLFSSKNFLVFYGKFWLFSLCLAARKILINATETMAPEVNSFFLFSGGCFFCNLHVQNWFFCFCLWPRPFFEFDFQLWPHQTCKCFPVCVRVSWFILFLICDQIGCFIFFKWFFFLNFKKSTFCIYRRRCCRLFRRRCFLVASLL